MLIKAPQSFAVLVLVSLTVLGHTGARTIGQSSDSRTLLYKAICTPPLVRYETERTYAYSDEVQHKVGNVTVVAFLQSSEFSSLQLAAKLDKLARMLKRSPKFSVVDFLVVNDNSWLSRASQLALRWSTSLPIHQATSDVYSDFDAQIHDVVILDKCGYLVFKVSLTDSADISRKVQTAISKVVQESPCKHCYASGS